MEIIAHIVQTEQKPTARHTCTHQNSAILWHRTDLVACNIDNSRRVKSEKEYVRVRYSVCEGVSVSRKHHHLFNFSFSLLFFRPNFCSAAGFTETKIGPWRMVSPVESGPIWQKVSSDVRYLTAEPFFCQTFGQSVLLLCLLPNTITAFQWLHHKFGVL